MMMTRMMMMWRCFSETLVSIPRVTLGYPFPCTILMFWILKT